MYNYEVERPKIFTDLPFLFSIRDQIRDHTHYESKHNMIHDGISFEQLKFTGDTWLALACIDLLLELKQIRCLTIHLANKIPTQRHRYTFIG